MVQKGFKLFLVLTAVAVLLGGQPVFASFSAQNHTTSESAATTRAGSAADQALYLPMVIKHFPFPTLFGVEMVAINPSQGLSEVHGAGNYWVRRNNAVLWSELQPTPGATPNWSLLSALETELREAAVRGMETILVVRGAPTWAQKWPGIYCGQILPEAFDDFAGFMGELVARYSQAPFNVKYWEIWNEPDASPGQIEDPNDPTDPGNPFGCWGDPDDPYFGGGAYGDLLSVVYPAIKAADPQAQVLFGGLLLDCNPDIPGACSSSVVGDLPLKFLEGVLKRNGANDGGQYFDGISFHAYDFDGPGVGRYANENWGSAYNTTGPVSLAKAQFVRGVLAAHGVVGKYLLNTEAALICDGYPTDCDPDLEMTKAYYVPQVYAASIADGLVGNLWFTAVTGWRGSSLMNSDLTPLPAFETFAFARQELRNAAFVRQIGEYPGVTGYEFDRGDLRIWLLWSLDGDPHDITLPGTPLAAWDAFGNAVSAHGNALTVSIEPVYLEWNP